MADVRDAVLQGVRAWLNAATGIGLAKIMEADQPMTRITLPYLLVNLPEFDETIGFDEQIDTQDDDENPVRYQRGVRRDICTVEAYGIGASEYLRDADLRLQNLSIQEILYEHHLSIRSITSIRDLSALRSDRREKRFAKDFEVTYMLQDDEPEALVEAESVEMDFDGETGDLVKLLTITL